MSVDPSDCPDHAWASIGVATVDGAVVRIWACERCTAWTTEPFDAASRVDWDETFLSG